MSLIVGESETCSVNLRAPLHPSPVHLHLNQGCESYLKLWSSCQTQTGSVKYTENHFLWLLTWEQVVCGVVETDTSPTPAALNKSQIHKRHGGQSWSGLWTATLEMSHLKKTFFSPLEGYVWTLLHLRYKSNLVLLLLRHDRLVSACSCSLSCRGWEIGEITECKCLSHRFLQSTIQRVHVSQISRHLSQCSMFGNGYFHKTGGHRRL